MTVELGVLDGVEVRVGGRPLDLGPAQQRLVLAALLVDVNETVSTDQLIDRVWGEQGTAQSRTTLYTYISRLRQALAGVEGATLTRQSGSYVLIAAPETVDMHHFRHLVGQARTATEDERAAALFERALGLWRGKPFATLDTPWINAVRGSLQHERLIARLEYHDVLLRCGRHGELLARLRDRAAEHPLDERLAGQLMLALYRCGRTADALDHYRRTRRQLADSQGIEPGPALQQLHQQILTTDPGLDPAPATPAAAASATRTESVVPRQLPAPPALFTGRRRELAQLSAALVPPVDSAEAPTPEAPTPEALTSQAGRGGMVVIAAVGGTGGIGKTYLALRWAHEHRQQFPDGELYVNLRGFDPTSPPVPPAVALRGFLDALGVEPAAIPDSLEAQAGLYRSLVAGKQMLIVLDNARETAQVTGLLPASPSCTVLITSRSQLGGLLTEHAATPLTLGVLAEAEARELLVRRLGQARAAAEPEAVTALLTRCAGLPLALAILAARATAQPDLPLMALAAELEEEATGRLDALDAGDLSADLRAVFASSYHALAPEAASVFALLGLAPGPDISLPAVASLIGRPLPATRRLLRTLEAAHLIRQHTLGRYHLHDLVRLFAAERVHHDRSETTRTAALHRLLDFYLHTAYHANRLLYPHWTIRLELQAPATGCTPHRCQDQEAARAWFEAELPNMHAAHQLAREHGWHTLAWQLPEALFNFRFQQDRLREDLDMWRAAIEATEQLRDAAAQAVTHTRLAQSCTEAGQYDEARARLEQALPLFDHLGDVLGKGQTHYWLGDAWQWQGDYQRALPCFERALHHYQAVGDALHEAGAFNAIGWCHARLGHYEQARAHLEQALANNRAEGDRYGEAINLDNLGYIAHRRGWHHQALDYYHQALTLYRETGATGDEADVLERLGDAHHALGQHAEAHRCWQQALDLYRTQQRTTQAAHIQQQLDALNNTEANSPTRAE